MQNETVQHIFQPITINGKATRAASYAVKTPKEAAVAEAMAAADGIELTPAHWEIIDFVRALRREPRASVRDLESVVDSREPDPAARPCLCGYRHPGLESGSSQYTRRCVRHPACPPIQEAFSHRIVHAQNTCCDRYEMVPGLRRCCLRASTRRASPSTASCCKARLNSAPAGSVRFRTPKGAWAN